MTVLFVVIGSLQNRNYYLLFHHTYFQFIFSFNYFRIYYVTPVSTQETGNQIIGSYSSKIDEIIRMVLNLVQEDSKVKIIIFSQWENILMVISKALAENAVKYRMKSAKFHISINEFKDDPEITCLLLPLLCGSKGLNLIEATHVFLVEPILNIDEELQAIGRVHRIGQTK